MYQTYPKSIARIKLQPKRNQCFFLMPFARTFDEIYSEIKTSLKPLGFSCMRADDIYTNRPIMTTLVCEIISSHFVIADLTDRSPNVFYEIGLAHSLRDMTSVILIAQGMDFVPFDLRQFPVIIYDNDNLKGLTTRIIKRILENKDFFEGEARLRERYLPQCSREADLEELVAFLGEKERETWRLILQVLDASEEPLQESEIIYGVFQIRADLAALATGGKLTLFRNLFKLYRDLVCRFMEIKQLGDYARRILEENRFPEFLVDDAEMNSLVIDFALNLFHHPRFKRRVVEWIFGYLARPKVAGIDINRAKIEHFVMHAEDADIRDALIVTLESSNSYLRETAADFVGEMRLEGSVGNLIFALERETSPFAARSMFSALGKLEAAEGAVSIMAWVKNNKKEIEDREWDFVTDHAKRALGKIDIKRSTHYLKDFLAAS